MTTPLFKILHKYSHVLGLKMFKLHILFPFQKQFSNVSNWKARAKINNENLMKPHVVIQSEDLKLKKKKRKKIALMSKINQ